MSGTSIIAKFYMSLNKPKWRNYMSLKNDVESFNIELGSLIVSNRFFLRVGMLIKCMRILPIRL